jgi:hypothetical protein
MKRWMGWFAMVMCLAILTPPAGAQATRDMITGVAPFSLGMSAAEALQADPALVAVSTPAFAPNIPPSSLLGTAPGCAMTAQAASYAAPVAASINGYPFTANLLLCFSGDKLGAIYVTWPVGLFPEDSRWLLTVQALARQLAASYSPSLILRFNVDDDMGAIVEMRDSQGNLLTMTADPGEWANINLAYVSAAYDQAVNGKRLPIATY